MTLFLAIRRVEAEDPEESNLDKGPCRGMDLLYGFAWIPMAQAKI